MKPLIFLFIILIKLVNSHSLLFTSFEKELVNVKLNTTYYKNHTINGSIYRNGFGKFETYEHTFNHLFDTSSLILHFNISDETYLTAKFLPSKFYNQSIYTVPLYRTLGGYTPDMTVTEKKETLKHWMHDNLNANIYMFNKTGDGILMALSDLQGNIILDEETLNYKGKYNSYDSFFNIITTAHPSKLYNSKYIYNVDTIIPNTYKFYYIDESINLEKNYFYEIKTDKLSYTHSFGLTDKYIIFIEYPCIWNIPSIINSTVILPSITWNNELKSIIHIIDIEKQTSYNISTDPFFSFHFINSYVEDNKIIFDMIIYNDSTIFDAFYMDKLLNNKNYPGGTLRRYIVDNMMISYYDVINEKMEMPQINNNYKGQNYKYFYSVGLNKNKYSIYKINLGDNKIINWYRFNHYPTEPIFIPNGIYEDDGYIASVVLDGNVGKSYLIILDAHDLSIVSESYLDTYIPFTCHGFYI